MAKILIVANPSTERDAITLVMEFAGHRCTSADDLHQAAKMIKQEPYDMVLADSTLAPGGSDEIVGTLRSASPKLAVMVLTEEADTGPGASEVITHAASPVEKLSPEFSAVPKGQAFLVLLPEQEALKRLTGLPETAGILNKLAVLYHSQKKYLAAEQLYKRALEITEQSLAAESNKATILNNLGRLYHDQNKFSEAEPLYKRSLAIIEQTVGPDHPKAAKRLRNLMDIYHAQDRDAAPFYERLKNIEKATPARAGHVEPKRSARSSK